MGDDDDDDDGNRCIEKKNDKKSSLASSTRAFSDLSDCSGAFLTVSTRQRAHRNGQGVQRGARSEEESFFFSVAIDVVDVDVIRWWRERENSIEIVRSPCPTPLLLLLRRCPPRASPRRTTRSSAAPAAGDRSCAWSRAFVRELLFLFFFCLRKRERASERKKKAMLSPKQCESDINFFPFTFSFFLLFFSS